MINWPMVGWVAAIGIIVLWLVMLAACATPAQQPQLSTCEEMNLRVMRGGELTDAEADHLLATCDYIVVPL